MKKALSWHHYYSTKSNTTLFCSYWCTTTCSRSIYGKISSWNFWLYATHKKTPFLVHSHFLFMEFSSFPNNIEISNHPSYRIPNIKFSGKEGRHYWMIDSEDWEWQILKEWETRRRGQSQRSNRSGHRNHPNAFIVRQNLPWITILLYPLTRRRMYYMGEIFNKN